LKRRTQTQQQEERYGGTGSFNSPFLSASMRKMSVDPFPVFLEVKNETKIMEFTKSDENNGFNLHYAPSSCGSADKIGILGLTTRTTEPNRSMRA
jgi:hypothetical protein